MSTCKDCSRFKAQPGWWIAAKSMAKCSKDLLPGGRGQVKNPFWGGIKGERKTLENAEDCLEFDDMGGD